MINRLIPLSLIALLTVACARDNAPVYVHEVNEVEVSQEGVEKHNLKSDLEFLSLAYSDLTGETISDQELTALVAAYSATGDKQLVADIIVRNLLNSPLVSMPDNQDMRNNLDAFIQETYLKFYVREPSAYEAWELKQLIESDPELTAEMIYYAFLTSDEYRFY